MVPEKTVHPWELIEDKDISQLVFAYEAILTEMRTHARADRTIKEWVSRLDFERDEFVSAMANRTAPETCCEGPSTLGPGWHAPTCQHSALKRVAAQETAVAPCEHCGAKPSFDGMWHKPSCPTL